MGKATPFWKKGIFCVRLNVEPSGKATKGDRETQEIVVGIDPGSKKEAFTVKSEMHTYLNIQADAVTWVKNAVSCCFDNHSESSVETTKKVKTRREMRRGRRKRITPCRKPRFNRARGGLSPSTKARWQWKLRVCKWLSSMFPITDFVVEDIKARTKGKRKWDVSFSPLDVLCVGLGQDDSETQIRRNEHKAQTEVGKKWFYSELERLGDVHLKYGYETKEERDRLGLTKLKDKLSNSFHAHCVDSWVLANWYVRKAHQRQGLMVGGHVRPENVSVLQIVPLRFHRRQLHSLQPAKGGVRRDYGGTRSWGFKRGSYVKHPKYGVCFVGGASKGSANKRGSEFTDARSGLSATALSTQKAGRRISLHSLASGKRLTQNALPKECNFLTYASFRIGGTVLPPVPLNGTGLRA